MPDVPRNAQSIITTSATTAPAAGTSETWAVTALASGIRTLVAGETYSLVDATTGATAPQQAEIVRITAATAGATSVTVTRGCDSTTPVAHANPSTFNLVIVAGSMAPVRWPSYAVAASSYALKNDYEPVRGIYNLKSSNTRLLSQGIGNAMLGGRALGGMTEHLIIGDSAAAGAVSSLGVTLFDRLDAWPLAMRDQLANGGIPANGTGMIRVADGPTAQDSRIVATGTWTNQTSWAAASTVGATATYSIDRSGSMLDVWYYDNSGAVVTVAVDGTTVGTITASGAAGWKNARYAANIIGGFSKVVLTVTTVGTGFFHSGLSVWTPNAGLVVHNAAQSGASASGTGATAWVDNSGSTSALGLVMGDVAGRRRVTSTASSTVGSSTLTASGGAFTSLDLGKPIDELNVTSSGRMFPTNCYVGAILTSTTVRMDNGVGNLAAPALAISSQTAQQISIGRDPSCVHIALGANDINALAASDTTITTAITTIRNRYPNSDCILHLEEEMAPSYISQARYATLQAAMYALADTLDVPLYDWRDRVGTYANGQTYGVYGDAAVHMTPATEAGIGSDLATIIGSGNGRAQAPGPPVLDNDLVNKAYIDRRKAKSSSATALTTVESVVLRLPVAASALALDDVLRYSGWLVPAATTVTTVRVHIGPLGTSADPALIICSATAATNAGARYIEGTVGITAIGASATFMGGGSEVVGAISAAGVATTSTSTFNSTVNNYVTVTVQNGTSTTTTLRGGVLEFV